MVDCKKFQLQSIVFDGLTSGGLRHAKLSLFDSCEHSLPPLFLDALLAVAAFPVVRNVEGMVSVATHCDQQAGSNTSQTTSCLLWKHQSALPSNEGLRNTVCIDLSDRSETSGAIKFYIKKWSISRFQCQIEEAMGNASFVWIPGIDWSFFDMGIDGIWWLRFNTYPLFRSGN